MDSKPPLICWVGDHCNWWCDWFSEWWTHVSDLFIQISMVGSLVDWIATLWKQPRQSNWAHRSCSGQPYPFKGNNSNQMWPHADAVENIDIGGPICFVQQSSEPRQRNSDPSDYAVFQRTVTSETMKTPPTLVSQWFSVTQQLWRSWLQGIYSLAETNRKLTSTYDPQTGVMGKLQWWTSTKSFADRLPPDQRNSQR